MSMERILMATAMALFAQSAWAENYALLVGVSKYPNLEERYWLKGPANDVTLVRTYLTDASPVAFDPQNIVTLADGVEDARNPTLDAIRAGFAEIAAKAQAGDFIYLHFSGHGTQAPALDVATEIDGLDEMFLPMDIGTWNDTTGAVENALVDDEIGTLIGSLRAKGATVWAVFDACHSGTVTRGAPTGEDDVRLRKVTPDALGVPVAALDDALSTTRALPDPRTRAPSPAADALDMGSGGGFVAFYAAQTNETTPEKRLPRGQPGRVSQGVFTYTLFETMAANPGITYRQLGQEVLRKYVVQNLALSTPMFEGDLDSYLFSGEAGTKIDQWPVRDGEFGLSLRAGQLQNLNVGDVLALLPTAASSVADALGYAKVSYADTFTTELEMVDYNGLAALVESNVSKGAFARRIAENVEFDLRVALPDANAQIPANLVAALDILAQEAGARLSLVATGADADIRLAVLPDSARPDAVWLLPSTGLFSTDTPAPSVGTMGRSAKEIAALVQDSLSTIGRAINLLRMAGQYNDLDLQIDLRLQTKNRKDRDLRDMDMTSVPVLIPDDQVHVLARNSEEFPVDANVLHIGSDYSITHFYRGRLQPGDTLKKGLFRITDAAFGRDRVVVILTPAASQSDIEDLRFLSQTAVEVSRGQPESNSNFNKALRIAGFGSVTRGAVALDDESGPAPVILQFDLDTKAAN